MYQKSDCQTLSETIQTLETLQWNAAEILDEKSATILKQSIDQMMEIKKAKCLPKPGFMERIIGRILHYLLRLE